MPATFQRLCAGEGAPDFRTTDIDGHDRQPNSRQAPWLLLSFYRYASCPLCNLRVHEISQQQARWRDLGLETWAVFQSPPEKMRQYLGQHAAPFPLIADPDERLYRLYRVERGWWGFIAAWIRRLPAIVRAVLMRGYLPGSVEGDLHRLPADFLIDPQGRLAAAHYGRDIGDHLSLAVIDGHLTGVIP